MKKTYILLLVLLGIGRSNSQTTISTSHAYGVYLLAPGGVSFNVQNTSTTETIRVREVTSIHSGLVTGIATVQVWYKTSAISAAPGAITAANGWICAGTAIISNIGSNPTLFLSTLHIDIPPSSTYGFVASTSSLPGASAALGAGVNTFTAGIANVLTGTGISWINTLANMAGAGNTPYGLVGGIGYITLTDCSSTVVAGTIDAIKGFCGTALKTYTLKNNTQAKGMTYQWQTGTTSTGPWTNISGATAPILNRTISSTTHYRCYLTCTASGASDTTPVFSDTLNPFYYCYCSSVPTRPDVSKIDSVRIQNVTTSIAPTLCQMYTDYRGIIPNVKVRVGTNLKATMIPGLCNATGIAKEFGAMYLDINQNAAFDAAERLGGANFSLLTAQPVTRTMAIPLSATLGTTGFRVMLYDSVLAVGVTAGITNSCGPTPATGASWGEVEDYLVDIIQDPIDANMNSIVNSGDKCSGSNDTIRFNVTNIGGSDINPLTVSYSINGGTPVTETFGNLTKGTTQTFAFSTLANISSLSNIALSVWHSHSQDTNRTNDTLVFSYNNFPTPTAPSVQNAVACNGSAKAILRAISNPPFMTRWYKDASGLLDTAIGNQFVVNYPAANTTYYAKSVITNSAKVGLPIYTYFGGAITGFSALNSPGLEATIIGGTPGITFDILRNKVTINSVKAKFINPGVAVVDIRNSGGTLLKQIPIAVPNPGVVTIPINYALPIGTGYRITFSTNIGCTGTWAYNTYPLSIPSVISLTGSLAAVSYGYTGIGYNAFYDWDVSYDACESALVPVTLTYIGATNNPIRSLRPRDTACKYPDYYINAGNNGATYLWQNGSTNQTILTPVTGMYTVTITNSVGCTVEDTSRVLIKNSPFFTLGLDKTICFGTPTVLKTGFTNAGYNHTWNTGSLDPEINIVTSGKYYVDVLNTIVNCGYNDTIEITVVPLPTVYLGRDTFACNNTPITINAPAKAGYSYLWDDASSGSSRNLTASKKVWVRVQDNSGPIACQNSDTVNVTIATLKKPNLGPDTVTCSASKTIGIIDSPNLQYRWNTGETTNQVLKSSSGTYMLTVAQVGTTCSFSDTIMITFIPGLPLDLGPNIQTCDKKVTLKANKGFKTYAWSPGPSSADTFLVSASGTYTVTCTNPCGTVSDNIVVDIVDTIPGIKLPEDTFICNDLILNIPGQPSTNTINWSTGESAVNTITVKETGNYWVSVRNACGTYSDAVYIIRDTTPIADFEWMNNGKFIAFENKTEHAIRYHWDFGNPNTDEDTSAQKNTSYLYDTSKLILVTVTLTAENSCGVKSVKSVIIDLTKDGGSSINSADEGRVEVYPNPTRDNIYIKNMEKGMLNSSIKIYSADGKVVISKENVGLMHGQAYGLDVSNLSAGSYLLIINNDNKAIHKKISITK